MFDLSLSLLGPFAATLGERPLYKFRTNKVQALLIYLVMEAEQVHRRETLMNLLWPDLPQPSAQVNLRQTIYRLRQAIPEVSAKKGKTAVPFLIAERQTVQINPEAAFFLDVVAFLEQIDTNPAQAVALYRSDFLSDFYLSDSNEFEEWAQAQRESLRRQVLDALESLTADRLQAGDYDDAQTYAWKQLEIDNLREIAYRQLMIALMQSGQRSAALSQYHICRDRLRDELGVEPTAETTTLYQQIQANTLPQETQPAAKETKAQNGRFHTYLLTDIESVVQLWDRHQQEMIPALHRHNTILEEQISQHGGRILELQGDKVRAVFENGRPLACALAIQEAFGREKWGRIGELRIRIGLHGGAAISDEVAFAQATPITAAGWGGQILASQPIHDALKLPDGAFWQLFGEHQLSKDASPVQLYGLLHPDLPHQSFPSLRTLSHTETVIVPPARLTPTVPHNLPQQPTPFIGREEELDALDELILDPKIRLITIVGPGGMGKTRLALASAERQLGQTAVFPDGVFFVHLAHIQTADQIIPAIAHALNFSLEGSSWQENRADQMPGDSRSTGTQLIDYLRHKQLFLVLDNFEHLLEGAGLVTEILQAAVQVQILVTSRERLQLREEQVYPIQGLDFPTWETPEDALQYTAVRLFVQSAHRVQPNFEITADDLTYLTRICRAVGGMPLGLELAASWVDMLSLPDIADEIQHSLDLLETDVRNVPQRHRSIRAVFDYSWQQLGQIEQAIFAQFAVFRGGFSRVAAQKITGTSIRTLANLVSKSFLQYNQQRDRYELHELMRQYAAEKLAEDEEQATAVRDHHSRYYCAALQHQENKIRAGHPQDALMQIEADQENARAAWHWALAQGDVLGIDQAIHGLCFYYEWRDRLYDGLAICEAARNQLRQLPASATLQRVLAKTLIRYGRFQAQFGQIEAYSTMEEAMTLLDQAEAAGEDVRAERAFALLTVGIPIFEGADRQSGRQKLEQSLELFQQLGDQWGEFNAHNALGGTARLMGNYHEARHRFEKNLALARSQHNQWEVIRALLQLGWVARDLVAYDEARRLFEECLALSRTQNNLWGESRALEALAYLAMFQGAFDAGGRYLDQAFLVARNNGFRSDIVNQKVNMAVVHWLSGNFDEANMALTEANALGKELGYPYAMSFSTIFYGELLVLTSQFSDAREFLQQGLSSFRQGFANPFVLGRAYRALGWLELAAGQYGEAQDWFEQSAETHRSMGNDEAMAWTAAGTGHALYGLGNVVRARKVVADALWTAVELQAFIPLLFLLPITILLLAKQGQDKWVTRLQTLALRTPFLAKAPLFTELVWSQLPRLKQAPPIEETSLTELRRELWTAVSQLLAEDVLV